MNYKDLPGIKTKIKYLEERIVRCEQEIASYSRFAAAAHLVKFRSERKDEAIREIQELQQQREDIINQMDMDEKTKYILLLHYDHGMKWREVAEAVGISLRQVHRIRKAAEG